MAKKKQHESIERKLKLRKQLLDHIEIINIYVPFIGDGDIAEELYSDYDVYGADIDSDRVSTAQENLIDAYVIEADCNSFPFNDQEFQAADFDAYSEPYEAFRSFWEESNKADSLVLFFTDGHRQGIKRQYIWKKPDGSREELDSKSDMREVYNFYYNDHIKPWFKDYIGDYEIIKDFKYRRKDQLYWGVVISKNPGEVKFGKNPTGYKEKFDTLAKEDFIQAIKNGATIKGACGIVGVEPQTYYNHREKYPKFKTKAQIAIDEADAQIEQTLHEAAMSGDTTAIKYWLVNRKPDKWSDKYRHELSGPEGEPIKSKEEVSFDKGQAESFIRAVTTNRERAGNSQEDSKQ